jgi:hypothetical protein
MYVADQAPNRVIDDALPVAQVVETSSRIWMADESTHVNILD